MKKRIPSRRPRHGFVACSNARHRTRMSLAEYIRREFEPGNVLADLDVFFEMPATVRRDLTDGRRA